jgi:hypothetical protein
MRYKPDEIELIEKSKSARIYYADETVQLWVKSNIATRKDGGFETALSETNPAHPNGQAIVTDRPALVALTETTANNLNNGSLVESSAEELATFEKETEERQETAKVARKEAARQKYIAAYGFDNGFEAAYSAIEQTDTLAGLIR